jgi:hypothetical protein
MMEAATLKLTNITSTPVELPTDITPSTVKSFYQLCDASIPDGWTLIDANEAHIAYFALVLKSSEVNANGVYQLTCRAHFLEQLEKLEILTRTHEWMHRDDGERGCEDERPVLGEDSGWARREP